MSLPSVLRIVSNTAIVWAILAGLMDSLLVVVPTAFGVIILRDR
jgi:hypothetical protein